MIYGKRIIIASILVALIAGTPVFWRPLLADTPSAVQQELERQLKDLEQQINDYQKQVSTLHGQKNSLANKIAQLKIEQKKLAALIQQTSLNIQSLDHQIGETNGAIADTVQQTLQARTAIGEILRNVQKQDRLSFVELLLSEGGLTKAANDLAAYAEINAGLKESLGVLKLADERLRSQHDRLAEQQDEQEKLVSIKSLQSRQLGDSIIDQKNLLTVTSGKETEYQAMLAESKKHAAEIRSRIYQLLEVEKQLSFGQAVAIAQWVSQQTGVRAAFLLAILTQESSLGKNVGTCNRQGDPPSKSWKVVMKPERDQQPFLTITSELGRDPDVTPVSCPMRDANGGQIGWGGAMGPAQFIPSTWMGYREKVKALTGKAADPWDIRDAFAAAAIKLKADGAGSVDGEWAAAMKYFSGSTNPRFRFYGDNVVAQAEKYQADIDSLAP